MDAQPGTPFFDFDADVTDIAETKFRANLGGDSSGWVKQLYSEYQAAGSPKNQRRWIADRLKNEFKSMDKPPAWVNMDDSHWPFHNDRPMVFIGQIPLKTNAGTAGLLDNGATAYFFGLADTGQYGELIMVYREVTVTRI
jgi:hypothetical protein